jgi:NADPH:quinone reductase-like Zn-dependent oxidoreductase
MNTAVTVPQIQWEPELLGQTVVVIGGSGGIGLEHIMSNTALTGATYDIDGGEHNVAKE